MRVAICDDDRLVLDGLAEIVRGWIGRQSQPAKLYVYETGESFLLGLEQYDFDVAFLDIQMVGMNGMEVARFVREKNTHMGIVFITHHRRFAIDAFGVQAFDYLVKPLAAEKCEKVLDTLLEMFVKRHRDVYAYRSASQSFSVQKADILYCKSNDHYIEMHLRDRCVTFREKMGVLINDLGYPRFFCCHKSYIVNLYNVIHIYTDHVIMSNLEKIPVSKGNWAELSECYIKTHMEDGMPGRLIF